METYDKIPDDWGKTLAQLRHDTGITQLELARRSGVSQCQISYIENGRRDTTLGTLELLLNSMEHQLEIIAR